MRPASLFRIASWFCLALAFVPPVSAADSIVVTTSKVRLNIEDPKQTTIGRLDWRGGVAIDSPDPRLGGLSALAVSADGRRLTALGDEGHWFTASLRTDGRGHLAGLGAGLIGRLTGLDGQVLKKKKWKDAESLAVEADGALLVSFERKHRIWRYPPAGAPFAASPTALPLPPGLERAPDNGGLEAIAVLGDGGILAIAEKQETETGFAAYLFRDGRWHGLTYARTGLFNPTGAARLPGGNLVVLERRYHPPAAPAARLVEIRAEEIRPGARLTGREIAVLEAPLILDNFEGVAARESEAGETLLYILSDDNFSPIQRTLLVMFALRP